MEVAEAEKKLQQIVGVRGRFNQKKPNKCSVVELQRLGIYRSACSFDGHSYQLISYDHEPKLQPPIYRQELSKFVASANGQAPIPDREPATAPATAVDNHKTQG